MAYGSFVEVRFTKYRVGIRPFLARKVEVFRD